MSRNPPKEVIDKFSEEITQLYIELGQALSYWSEVEAAVCAIYLTGISARNFVAAQKAFFRVVSFDGKLSACDAAITEALEGQDSHIEEWIEIARISRREKQNRNKLAHAQLLMDNERGPRLFPYYSSTDPQLPDWNGGWTDKRIKEIKYQFLHLDQRMVRFQDSLANDLDMWPTEWRPET